jgi:hypothetical protein
MGNKDNPTLNRIFTGNDKEMSEEQARNLIKSPEYDKFNRQKIKDIISAENAHKIRRVEEIQRNMAIDLIRKTKDGEVLALILKCYFAGYSDKKIAKTLMKAEKDLPHFTSLQKAIDFVKAAREEAKYRVMVELNKRKITPVILN